MNRRFFFGWLAFLAVLGGLAAWGWHWLDSGFDLSVPHELGNVYVERSEYSQPQVSVQWQGNGSLLIHDDAAVIGRIASEAEKRVTVNLGWLGWFRSADVAVRYADLPLRSKTNPK